MAGPYPLATVACSVTPQGITGPGFSDILASFTASLQSIIGSDVYLDPSTKDGQLLAVLAQAQSDDNQATIAAYNSYNIGTAQGTALDGAAQNIGVQRLASSASTVILNIVGVVGTVIPVGAVVQDQTGNLWNLPAPFTIPLAGTIAVTATCQAQGNIVALPNTVTIPYAGLVAGWQSVTNPAAAVPGAPIEVDGIFRGRLAASTGISGRTGLSNIESNIANVPGVSRSTVYQNDGSGPSGDEPDVNGIPVHYLAAVVLGGDALAVATAIQQAKDVGAGTLGSISEVVIDPSGVACTINFYPLSLVRIYQAITILPLTGYTSAIGAQILAAVAAFVSAGAIGQNVYLEWCRSVASMSGATPMPTFVVLGYSQDITPTPTATADLVIAFNAAATLAVGDVSLTVATLYNPVTSYSIGNAVSYLNEGYVSLVNTNVGNTPSISPTQWSAVI